MSINYELSGADFRALCDDLKSRISDCEVANRGLRIENEVLRKEIASLRGSLIDEQDEEAAR